MKTFKEFLNKSKDCAVEVSEGRKDIEAELDVVQSVLLTAKYGHTAIGKVFDWVFDNTDSDVTTDKEWTKAMQNAKIDKKDIASVLKNLENVK